MAALLFGAVRDKYFDGPYFHLLARRVLFAWLQNEEMIECRSSYIRSKPIERQTPLPYDRRVIFRDIQIVHPSLTVLNPGCYHGRGKRLRHDSVSGQQCLEQRSTNGQWT